jgi:hypothetical protein
MGWREPWEWFGGLRDDQMEMLGIKIDRGSLV